MNGFLKCAAALIALLTTSPTAPGPSSQRSHRASVTCQNGAIAVKHERRLRLVFLGLRLRGVLRPRVRVGLRVADSLGQHLAQFSLGLRGCARD